MAEFDDILSNDMSPVEITAGLEVAVIMTTAKIRARYNHWG